MKPFLRDTRCAHVPQEAQQVINRSAKELFQATVSEPTLVVIVPLSHAPQGLLDVLCDGIGYQVKDGSIYLWFGQEGRMDTAGYYRLVRFEYIGHPSSLRSLKKAVKFTLSASQKL